MARKNPRRDSSSLDLPYQKPHGKELAGEQEDYLHRLIDKADMIRRYSKFIKNMNTGTLEVPGFLKAVSQDAAFTVAQIMIDGDSDKVRLEAAKDILDRSGHTKTTKVSIAGQVNVDHDTSRLELINIIMSSVKKVGIKTKQDEEFSPALAPKPETVELKDGEWSAVAVEETEPEDGDGDED